MQNHYTARQVCLMQRLRQLWEQHVYWTRFFIISTAAGLADLSPVTDRLLQNPKDFARALTPFFGARTAAQISSTVILENGRLRRCTFSPTAKFFFTRIACDTMESPLFRRCHHYHEIRRRLSKKKQGLAHSHNIVPDAQRETPCGVSRRM